MNGPLPSSAARLSARLAPLGLAAALLAGCAALLDDRSNGAGMPCVPGDPDPCPPGTNYRCVQAGGNEYRCLFSNPTPEDSGSDGTVPPQDSGRDTGIPDAGTPDTGPVDAGPPLGTSGGPCKADATCLDSKDFCATAGEVDFLTATTLCTSMCRKTSDCATGEFCAASKAAAGVCVPRALVGRGAGTAATGAACATGNDCLSGFCPDSKCRDACAATSDCTGTDVCAQLPQTFSKAGSGDTYVRRQGLCVPPGTKKAAGAACVADADCASGVCGNFSGGSFCAPSCGSAADCAGGACFTGPYLKAASLENVRICAGTSGTGAAGATCSADSTCKEENCVGGGTCAPLCSRPSDCTSGRCRVLGNRTSILVAVCAN